MKVTITKEIEVEIEFPAYYTWGYCYYKIESDKDYIQVNTDEEELSIARRKPHTEGFVSQVIQFAESIKPETFLIAFEQVFNKLEHEQAKIDPSHRFNQQPEEENGLEESERNEDKINEYYELEQQNTE